MAFGIAACSGEAIIDGAPNGSGGAGSTTTEASTTIVSSSTGTFGGCASNSDCTAADFCDFPDGTCGGEGVCRARPQDCDADCPGVCACDGQTYCNSCNAWAVGVDSPGACAGAQEAVVRYLPTAVERIGILVWDPPTVSCVFYTLVGSASPPEPNISVLGDWEVESSVTAKVNITRDACFESGFPPTGYVPNASGDIVVYGPNGIPQGPGCSVDMDLVVDLGGGMTVSHRFVDWPVLDSPCDVDGG